MVANRCYEPFGSLLSANGTGASVYGFAGEQLDASTGLVYLRARYLDTDLGRFTQVDPSGWEANPYLYAGANPVNLTDPTGMWRWRRLTWEWQHRDIENWYTGADVVNKQLEYTIPAIGTRPDMFNSLLGGVYEIEPVYMAGAPGHGWTQMLGYVLELNLASLLDHLHGVDPDTHTQPYDWSGVLFLPGSGIDVPKPAFREQWQGLPLGYQLVADYAGPGLVLYWLEPPPEVVLAEALAAIGVGYAKLLRENGWSPRPSLRPQPADIQYVLVSFCTQPRCCRRDGAEGQPGAGGTRSATLARRADRGRRAA